MINGMDRININIKCVAYSTLVIDIGVVRIYGKTYTQLRVSNYSRIFEV